MSGLIEGRYVKPHKAARLSTEARCLAKLLKQLGNTEQATDALEEAARDLVNQGDIRGSKKALGKFQSLLQRELAWIRKGKNRGSESELAKSVERAFEASLREEPKKNRRRSAGGCSLAKVGTSKRRTAYNVFMSEYDATVEDTDDAAQGEESLKIVPLQRRPLDEGQKRASAGTHEHPNTSGSAHFDDVMTPPPTTAATTSKSSRATRAALISDSDSPVEGETQGEDEVDPELLLMELWDSLLETVHLHIASRTGKTRGAKTAWTAYRLAGPTTPLSTNVAQKVQKEFTSIYDGSIDDLDENRSAAVCSECRAYAVQRINSAGGSDLWLQINVGRSDCPEKKKPLHAEFVAMIPTESNLVALTVSRAASRSRFTPYVLSALEAALTCSIVGGYRAKDANSQRIDDLSGSDPHELLRTAQALESRKAVGRFASYAKASPQDPISELQDAATASLLQQSDMTDEREIAARHGRKVAAMLRQVDLESKGQASLVASNRAGTRRLIDHTVQERSRRKRGRDEAFGSDETDCPVRTCVRWDWMGRLSDVTTACTSSASYEVKEEEDPFRCRIALKGSNVFGGLRVLMEAGLMEGPLPDYVRDAPSLGGSISVNNGALVLSGEEKKGTENRVDRKM